MANQLIFALPRVTDSNGDPASGALAYFYQTGTTSPVTVHTDTGLSVAHASPVVADSGGAFAQVFYGGATDVKVVVKTSAGVTLYQYDPCPMITGVSSDAEGISFSPITGNAATNVQDAIEINTLAIAGAVPETRSISAGTGLTGGGDLSANRTISLDLLDEDDMATDSATKAASQQSIKAFATSISKLTRKTRKTASGTSIDFTGIPVGTSEVIVMFDGVMTNGTTDLIAQIGDAGGFETTGYASSSSDPGGNSASTSGFVIRHTTTGDSHSGMMHLTLMDAASFQWAQTHGMTRNSGAAAAGGGVKSLSEELTQIRITTGGGDTFTAGAINISYR